jgi:phage shock protein A
MRSVLLVVLLMGCESKIDKIDKTIDKLEDKVKNNATVQKVDKGLDKLDSDEASGHLTKAKEMIAKGEDPAEACSWVDRAGTATDTTKELDKLCKVDVPMARATKAVVAAEKAKAEQPSAPSLTECSSDDWAAMKTKLEGSSDARWADLKARWSKVCP